MEKNMLHKDMYKILLLIQNFKTCKELYKCLLLYICMLLKCKVIHEDGKYQLQDSSCLWQ